MARFWYLLPALALCAGLVVGQPLAKPGLQPADSPETKLSDEEVLKEAGLSPTDGAKLVAYLKQRTLSDSEKGRIDEVIARFAADDFDTRLQAMEEVERYGPAAVSPLKAASSHRDPEVAYRAAQALKKLEKVPHAAVAAAAVRAVVRLKPPEAAAALLGFLPLADTEQLADEIRTALVALALRDGKPEPVLVAALNDPSPVRRAAAYVALVEGGPSTERIRIKDAYQLVKDAVRKDPDPEAKFRGLWTLVQTTREKEFVPDLIAMVPQLPRGRLWQLEEYLLQLSGEHPAGGRFGKTPESLGAARDAWAGWWQQKGGAVDLVKLDFKPRIHGFTDIVEWDPSGYGRGRVVTLGPDLKEAWQLTGVTASDARMLPNGRMLVIEQNFARVSEYDANGKMVSQRRPGNQPLFAEPSGDGLLLICRGAIIEYDKEGKVNFQFNRPTYDIMAGRRLPNGDIVFVTYATAGENCFRLDPKGKEVGKGITVGRLANTQNLWGIDVIGEETILLCTTSQVAEYDLKTGKQGWKHATPNATSVQRLPNGNTLIASLNANKVIEVDPEGNEVWEYTHSKDGPRVARAYRR